MTLNINNNYITSLPSSLTFLNELNVLNADSNQLSDVPIGVCDLNSLTLLSVSNNQICNNFFSNSCSNVNVVGQENQNCED